MFSIDRLSPISLACQIEDQIRQLITLGSLPGGAKLMSIRQLASHLKVSPNTVMLAYDRLVASALIDSRGDGWFFVAFNHETTRPESHDIALEAGEEQEPVWLAQQNNDQRAGVLLASSGALPPSWLQDAVPAAAIQRALANSSAGMASRCPPQGLPELREHIALLLRSIGIAADARDILTCFGGSHAIDLICRSFLQPGDTVLVEDPGYFLMFARLKQDNVQVIPVKRNQDGFDLEALESACREHRPRLVFVQTAVHSPTGWSSSPANLHKLLMLAKQYDFCWLKMMCMDISMADTPPV